MFREGRAWPIRWSKMLRARTELDLESFNAGVQKLIGFGEVQAGVHKLEQVFIIRKYYETIAFMKYPKVSHISPLYQCHLRAPYILFNLNLNHSITITIV